MFISREDLLNLLISSGRFTLREQRLILYFFDHAGFEWFTSSITDAATFTRLDRADARWTLKQLLERGALHKRKHRRGRFHDRSEYQLKPSFFKSLRGSGYRVDKVGGASPQGVGGGSPPIFGEKVGGGSPPRVGGGSPPVKLLKTLFQDRLKKTFVMKPSFENVARQTEFHDGDLFDIADDLKRSLNIELTGESGWDRLFGALQELLEQFLRDRLRRKFTAGPVAYCRGMAKKWGRPFGHRAA